MALRVREDEVRAIIDNDPNISMVPFIEMANALTDHVSSQDSNSILNDTLLIQIEKNLAAHFYAHRDLQFASHTIEKTSADFQGKTGMGLDSTLWGQNAKRFDLTGTLARLDTEPRPKASFLWLGLPPSQQTPYTLRD